MSKPKGHEPKTYDAVIRVSRRNGRDGDSFLAPDEQRKIILAWVEGSGHKIAEWYDETDSVSGKTTNRVGLQAALKRAKDGKSDGIVVAKVDRFSRNMVEGLSAVKTLEKNGRDFIAVKDGLTGGVSESRNPTARLMRGLLFLLADWQLDSLTDQWETVRETKVAAGVHLQVPFGYQRSVATGGRYAGERKATTLEPKEPEASMVAEAFAMRGRGSSWQKIADYLNTQCASPSGGVWTLRRARAMIHCKTYLGHAYSGKLYRKDDAHPPLVTQEAYDAAHARAGRRHAQPEGGYPLSGLVRCGGCGYVMSVQSEGDGRHRYYKCSRVHANGRCAVPCSVQAGPLEDMVARRFLTDYGDLAGAGSKLTTELADAAAAVEATRRRHEVVLNMMPEDASGAALLNWQNMERQRAADVADAELVYADVRADALGSELPTDLLGLWADAPMTVRREWIGKVFGVIAVRRRVNRAEPLAGRVLIIGRTDMPADLPGRGVAGIRPIPIGPERVAGVELAEVAANGAGEVAA